MVVVVCVVRPIVENYVSDVRSDSVQRDDLLEFALTRHILACPLVLDSTQFAAVTDKSE